MKTFNTPRICLSNGHAFSFMVASGALSFDGKGWPWERPLESLGIIDTSLFTIVSKTVTKNRREGNLSFWHPWTCIKSIPDGWINKVGLTNSGVDWWFETIGKHHSDRQIHLVGSAFGDREELLHITKIFNACDLCAVEVNVSCPNNGHALEGAKVVADSIEAVAEKSTHPVITKLSIAQPYLEIARELTLRGCTEAIALNSVPWEKVYPTKTTPLHKLEQRVQGGGGGVSGKAAQAHNWKALKELSNDPDNKIPVIGPSVWEYEDMETIFNLGAKAVSFGSIHIGRPWAPTSYVKRWNTEHR